MSKFSYIPHTEEDQSKMLRALNLTSVEQLFEDIPQSVRMTRPLALPSAMPELTLERHMRELAGKNLDMGQVVSFLGGGSYEHYQPSVVDAVIGRSEFYTSYTPYQPEISQGMLQAIFEYQTMVAELTGMDLANASMYDGPTAMAEAGIVCCSHTKRNQLLVASSVHPEYRAVLQTYADGQSIDVTQVAFSDGVVDLDALEKACTTDTAGILIQYPNFFGAIEDVRKVAEIAHRHGALLVVAAYPIALGMLESPGALGADIVVAEGQSLGNAPSFGGPYLGIMATRKELMRKLPGRIVGETTDEKGNRGFVLTLQAREQHIRREKASSNICSNQALNALAATVFLSYMGPQGLHELAMQNYHKAHYLYDRLRQIKGVSGVFRQPFFNEFVVQLDSSAQDVQNRLLDAGYLFGYALERHYESLKNAILLTVTEVRTREEMDGLCSALEGAL